MAENLLQTCGDVYSIELASCATEIVVSAGLTPSTSYWYKITDKHGNVYGNAVTTDDNGDFSIDVTDFTVGLFNPYAGAFTLQVFSSQISCAPLTMTLCEAEYRAVSMTFVKVASETDLSTVQISCCE